MIRLKIILQYNIIYILLLLLALFYCFIITNIDSGFSYNGNFEGTLIDKKIDDKKVSLILKNKVKIIANYYYKDDDDIDFFNRLDLGIYLNIKGDKLEISDNTIPNTFNYKNYLKYKNIEALINVDNYEIINNHTNIFYKFKNWLRNYINGFESRNYLEIFIIGKKEYLDNDTYQMYQKLGVSHIFAISGMHITILSGIILWLLGRMKVNGKYIIVIIFLLFYLFITNYTASVFRCVMLFIVIYLNKKLDLNISSINCYFISISCILFINPYYIYDIGFIYSSVISYALIRYSKLIKGNYIISIFKVSILAFLFSLPITIFNNYEINILSVINNLFFVPVISLIIYPLSLITLFIKLLDPVLFYITNILEIISKFLLVYNVIIPKLSYLQIAIYYILLILFMKTYHKYILLLMIIILVIPKFCNLIDDNYYIYYLDVGQGDSTLLRYKNDVILIDTGGKINFDGSKLNYQVSDNSIKFMKSIGIGHIDYLILTHGDYDHMGDAINLIDNFKVDNVVFNNDEFNKLEIELVKVLEDKSIKYYRNLNEIIIGKNKLYFLNTKEYDNENNNSNVIYLKLNNYQFLFMGDAGINREIDILDKYNLSNIDFIKIGHHGSNSSSSKTFIDSIKPKNCFISVGKNNRYGHPKDSVLDTLDDYCDIYRTDLNGTIEIKINNSKYYINTINKIS